LWSPADGNHWARVDLPAETTTNLIAAARRKYDSTGSGRVAAAVRARSSVSAMARWIGAIAAVSVLALTAACNSDDKASQTPDSTPGAATPAKPAGPPTATIKNNKVSPATLRVSTGATVTIHNNDAVGHRLDNRANHIYSGTIRPHSKDEITLPPDPGTYVFTDPNNPSVKLTVKVR
jgi:hypothetical protein